MAVGYYENATHQLRNITKTQKINFTKAQEKDIQKRIAFAQLHESAQYLLLVRI